jgi:hypothetical protein
MGQSGRGISEQTFYRWKKRFGDLGTAEGRELRQLRLENRNTVVTNVSLQAYTRAGGC